MDQILVRVRWLGRAQQACTRSALAVESDHIPTSLVPRVGRMQRRQKKANQSKPAKIAALRNPETRKAYADAVGSTVVAWLGGHPAASLEARAEALREIMSTTAREVCGKQERREEGWFAANQEVLMVLVEKRNGAAMSVRRRQGKAAAVQAAAQLRERL